MEWTKRDIKKRIKSACQEHKAKCKMRFTKYGVQILYTYRTSHLFKVISLRRLPNRHYKGYLKMSDIEGSIVEMMKESK